ncbi:MAG: nitroreductase family deazaflavin-dependent oxidoreductase [Candidatus Binataceae bacterium]
MEEKTSARLGTVASRQTLVLTHVGRKSGKSYDVTIWFVVAGDRIILPTANVARNWVKNLRKTPAARIDVGGEKFQGRARFIDNLGERTRLMALVRRKYWIFMPIMAFGQLLALFGAMSEPGAFELTLDQVS